MKRKQTQNNIPLFKNHEKKEKKFLIKKHYIISILILFLAVIFFLVGLILLVTWKNKTTGLSDISGIDFVNTLGVLHTLNFGPEKLQIAIIFSLIIAPIFFIFSFLYFIFAFLSH